LSPNRLEQLFRFALSAQWGLELPSEAWDRKRPTSAKAKTKSYTYQAHSPPAEKQLRKWNLNANLIDLAIGNRAAVNALLSWKTGQVQLGGYCTD
jgi:hypothetical protein